MLLLFWCTICFQSCSKHDLEELADATLLGFDLRECVCCGGMLVQIKNDISGVDETYQWYMTKGDLGVGAIDSFPVNCRIKYDIIKERCVISKAELDISKLVIIK
ncbi:MAG: hypothetical protein IPO92_11065 [Saprospiraceae bacterium]|nr:hypothetical protein [Saprospiraceae bacterium]